jgi:predicted aminopeptidase
MIKPVKILCVGGTIGASYGSYRGYILNRHKSYNNCAIETTLSCFIGTGVGVWAVFVSPILIPMLCVCVPVAGGAMIAKYFDKNAERDESAP